MNARANYFGRMTITLTGTLTGPFTRPQRLARQLSMIIAVTLTVVLVAACSSSGSTDTADESAAIDAIEAAATATPMPPTAVPATEPPPTPVPDPTATVEPTAVPEPTEEPTPEPTEEPEASGPVGGDTTVTLLDPGAEPRNSLRLDYDASCAVLVTFDQVQELEQVVGENPLPAAGAVGTTLTMRMTAEPAGGGNYRVNAEIVGAGPAEDTDPVMAEALEQELGALIGVSTTAELDPQGIPVPGTAEVTNVERFGAMAEMVEATTAQAASPFPAEPVGLGAVWETSNTIEIQGMLATTVTTSTLTEVEGSLITVDITGKQTVNEDAVMTMPGVSAPVLAWDTTVFGTSQFDLKSPAPVRSQSNTEAFQSFAFGDETLDQEISMSMSIASTLEPGCDPRPGRVAP